MQFNSYQIYSVNSEVGEEYDFFHNQRAQEFMKHMDEISNGEEAKEFISDYLNIREPILNYPFYDCGTISYEVFEDTFSIEIIGNSEHYIYCYEN